VRAAFWWIDRWRQSQAYMDMTAEEQGLARNLWDELWLRKDHVIPDDQRILARVSGDPEAWSRSGPKVLRWMKRVDGGWTNDTALEIIEQSENRAEKQRRYRNKQRNETGNDGYNNARSPSPSPSQDKEQTQEQDLEVVLAAVEGESEGETQRPPASPPCSSDSELEAWAEANPLWIDHDPEDPDQAALVARVLELEAVDAGIDGRPPSREGALRILAAVSGTRAGKSIEGDLRGVTREWLLRSLATCETLAEENDLTSGTAAGG